MIWLHFYQPTSPWGPQENIFCIRFLLSSKKLLSLWHVPVSAGITSSVAFIDHMQGSLMIATLMYVCHCRDTAGQERFRTITTAYYRGAMVTQYSAVLL